jgi:hypothetical protein
MQRWLDACVVAPDAPPAGGAAAADDVDAQSLDRNSAIEARLPPGAAGAVLYGPSAGRRRAELSEMSPTLQWHYADTLAALPAVTQQTALSGAADVLHVCLDLAELEALLKQPPASAALSAAAARPRPIVRLALPPGSRLAVWVRRRARGLPDGCFWLDPFEHGPKPGWQAHVKLAEQPNVWVTTLGLDPCVGTLWTREAAQEALHFLIGEVGAAKLLYASGSSWDQWRRDAGRPFREWLAANPSLDAKEVEMVLLKNAAGLLAPPLR